MARNQLTLDDIRGSGTFGAYNIVFNDNLYRLTSSVPTYLSLQHRVRRDEANLGDLRPKYKSSPGNVLANIMYVNGDEDSFSVAMEPGNNVFRSTSDIEQIIDIKMPNSDKQEKAEITTDVLDDIINSIKSQEDAKKALSYLADVWSIDFTTQLNTVDDNFGGELFKNRDAVQTKHNETLHYKNLLRLSQYEYTPRTVLNLLVKLMKKAGFEEKKKA